IGADARAFADLDRPKHLRARSDHDPVAQRRMPFPAHARRRIGAAQGDVLIDRDVVADLRCLTDYAEAVIEKEAPADLRRWMDVDGRQKTREMIHQARDEIELTFPQPVRDPVQPKCQYA